jgi:hypothetical protein
VGSVKAVSKFACKILGLLALAGFAAVVVGIIGSFGIWWFEIGRRWGYERAGELESGVQLLALFGSGLVILAGIPWAHTPGKKWLKAALLALVGFIVGGPTSAFIVYLLTPRHADSMSGFFEGVVGFVVGGLFLASLGVLWTIRFHRRYAAEPDRCSGPRPRRSLPGVESL